MIKMFEMFYVDLYVDIIGLLALYLGGKKKAILSWGNRLPKALVIRVRFAALYITAQWRNLTLITEYTLYIIHETNKNVVTRSLKCDINLVWTREATLSSARLLQDTWCE